MPYQLPADADLTSPQVKLITEWLQGVHEMNVDKLGSFLTDDFRRFVYPRSLGHPEQTKAEWLKEIGGAAGFATGFDTNVHCIIEGKGKVVVHSTGKMENSYGLDTTHESIAIIHLDADKDGRLKIKQLENFFDSKVFSDVHKSILAAMATDQATKSVK